MILVGTIDHAESRPLVHLKSLKTVAALPRFLKSHGPGVKCPHGPICCKKKIQHIWGPFADDEHYRLGSWVAASSTARASWGASRGTARKAALKPKKLHRPGGAPATGPTRGWPSVQKLTGTC